MVVALQYIRDWLGYIDNKFVVVIVFVVVIDKPRSNTVSPEQ